jgi:hypothetical protein
MGDRVTRIVALLVAARGMAATATRGRQQHEGQWCRRLIVNHNAPERPARSRPYHLAKPAIPQSH